MTRPTIPAAFSGPRGETVFCSGCGGPLQREWRAGYSGGGAPVEHTVDQELCFALNGIRRAIEGLQTRGIKA